MCCHQFSIVVSHNSEIPLSSTLSSTVQTFKLLYKSGSRAAAPSKVERFVIIVNGFQPLAISTKCSISGYTKLMEKKLNHPRLGLNFNISQLNYFWKQIIKLILEPLPTQKFTQSTFIHHLFMKDISNLKFTRVNYIKEETLRIVKLAIICSTLALLLSFNIFGRLYITHRTSMMELLLRK